MTGWHQGRMAGLDLETTGTSPHEDRIITAAVVHTAPDQRPSSIQWLIHPQRDIPDEASNVHGWTLDRLEERLAGKTALRIHRGREEPLTRDGALFEIAAQAATVMHVGAPLVIANAPFDLTMLEAELARQAIDSLASRPSGIRGVVDPMVLDKAFDPYRKSCYKAPGCKPEDDHHECGGCRGSKQHACGGCGATNRKLASLCRHYGAVLPSAHTADADALAALRLAVRLAALWTQIASWKLGTLFNRQVTWRKEQMDGLRSYFDRNGIEHDGCAPEWPLIPARNQAAAS